MLGDSVSALANYQDAADSYRRHGLIRDAARADVGVARNIRRQGRFEEARPVLDQALAVLEPEADADTIEALAELAALHSVAGRADEADRVSTAALVQAQALGAPDRTIADLLVGRGLALGQANRRSEALAYLREAVRLAEATQDGATAGAALLNATDLLLFSDPSAAAEAGRAAVAHCRRVGNRYYLEAAAGNLVQALLLAGEWDEARDAYRSGVQDDQLRGALIFDFPGLLLAVLSGDDLELAALLPLIQHSADTEDPQELAQLEVAIASAATYEDRHAEALDHAWRALTHCQTLGPGSESVRWSWPIAADAALAVGDTAEVSRLLDWLDAYPPGHVPPLMLAESLRVRAKLLAAQSAPTAMDVFAAAVKALRALGFPFHLAVGLLDYAEYRAARGDPRSADQFVAEAESIARRLGAGPLLERATRLASARASQRQPPLPLPAAAQ
jgi:tetratricopeptide (TPR) repeat protein